MLEPAQPLAIVFRRSGDGFSREVYTGLDATLPLPETGVELPLAEIYEAVELGAELDEEDEPV